MYIILVYDISNENNGQRRWNRVFKICKQYLNHIQNSVFEGEILESDLFKLKKKIQKEITDDEIMLRSPHEEKGADEGENKIHRHPGKGHEDGPRFSIFVIRGVDGHGLRPTEAKDDHK